MDVVCDRCRAEYEFDDALVSERGTTVKCTSCGHQFKIYRPSSHPEAARPWNLRRPDGTVIPFDSLAVLQKWILEGRVARTDEISRAGDAWKPLGAIAELESFFSTAELRSGQPTTTKNSNRPPPPPLRAPTPRPPPPHAAPHAPHAPPLPPLPTPSHRPGAGTSGHPTRPDGTDASRTAGAPAIPAPPRVPHLDVPRAATATADGYALGAPALPPPPDVAIGPPTPPRAAPSLSPPPLPSDPPPRAQPEPTVDDDEPLPPVAQRSSGLVVGVALGLLVTVGGVGFAWHMGYLGARPTASPTAGPSVATPPPDLTPRLANARRSASRVTRASLEEAHEELTRALAVAPDDAAVLAARAAVMASWSEMLRVRADELEARAHAVGAEAPQLRAEAALVRRDGVERLARARTDAERAEALAQRAAPRGEARAALEADLADVARIAGDVPGARRHLDAAREAGGGAGVDLVASLVARDTGLAPQAVEGLRAVVAREANAVRARLALARLLGAQGDITGARAELDAVTRDVPDHEDAVRLSRAALAGEPPMRGTQVAAVAPAPATTADAAAPQAADAAQRAPASGDEPVAARSYDQLVREGDRLQDEGHTGQARERYRAALAMRSNGCEALAGLGFVALEERELSSAVSYFRRSLSSDPGYSEALVGLGEAYSSQQQYQQALDAYQRYLRQEPGGEHAHMARRQIESLQERVRAPQGSEQAPSPGN